MPSAATTEPDPSSLESLRASAANRLESDEQLLRRYQGGDARAREELVVRFMPLTRRLAGRYRHAGESQDDLEQVACMGLIKAVDRYDPDLGPFVRYAVPNIMGELKRHFRDKGWGMHVPRSVQERFLKVNDAVDQLSGHLGRSPSPKDIAELTGLAVEEVLEALEAGARSEGELIRRAWSDAPAPLYAPTALTLRAHLDKLAEEGRLPEDVDPAHL